MLVLSRKHDESIQIGLAGEGVHTDTPITIKVLEFRGDKVRIGIEAERGVVIHRQEIALAIESEREALTQPAA